MVAEVAQAAAVVVDAEALVAGPYRGCPLRFLCLAICRRIRVAAPAVVVAAVAAVEEVAAEPLDRTSFRARTPSH